MKCSWLLIVLFAAAACASAEKKSPVDARDRYLVGCSAAGPVESAEFTYENRGASLRFPPPTESRTFTRLSPEAMDAGADWPDAGAAGLGDEDDYDPNTDFGYYGNEYGGAGRIPRPIRPPRPPDVRPPPRPEPPIAKPDPDPEKPSGPAPGREDRRKAKSAPEKPSRSRDATKAPASRKR